MVSAKLLLLLLLDTSQRPWWNQTRRVLSALLRCYLVFDVAVFVLVEHLNLLLEGDVIFYVLEIRW